MASSWRGSGRTRAKRHYTPSRATTLPARMGSATKIGSKRTFQIKLGNGLALSTVTTTFTVPRASDRTPVRLDLIFIHMGGPSAHVKLGTITWANDDEEGSTPVELSQIQDRLFCSGTVGATRSVSV